MRRSETAETRKKGRSRVFSAILSLILPGLGQVIRGRILTGLLFFLNVALYILPLFVPHEMQYDIQTPSLLVALGIWVFSAMDAFLHKSSFLVLALLVSLFFFGSGFFGAYFILPHIDI